MAENSILREAGIGVEEYSQALTAEQKYRELRESNPASGVEFWSEYRTYLEASGMDPAEINVLAWWAQITANEIHEELQTMGVV